MSKVTLKLGEEFEPITKDNIAEVLEYNGISQDWFSLSKNRISYHWTSTNNIAVYSSSMFFDNPKWLEHLEVEFGKLKPLPKKSNPFDVVKIGQWVRYIGEDRDCIAKGKWYQKASSGKYAKALTYIADDGKRWHNFNREDWDLTDIRDYNPDEEITLKVGDKIKFNYLDVDILEIDSFSFIYSKIRYKNTNLTTSFGSINDGHIFSVNGRQGKYVIPPFDFVQTLLDNGFNATESNDSIIVSSNTYNPMILSCFKSGRVFIGQSVINPIPANAKRLIDAANILKDLEIK